MSFLYQLERKFGRFTFPHLLLVLLAGQCISVLFVVSGTISFTDLKLIGANVLYLGEYYRLFTFLIDPLETNPIWFFIFINITWLTGSALQNDWGDFRFNLFLFVSWIGSVITAFLIPSMPVTNFYFFEVLWLAFAKLYPNFQVRIFFVLPVKAKYLGYLGWALIALTLIGDDGYRWLAISSAIIPYLLFFGKDLFMDIRGQQRASAFRHKAHISKTKPRHVCSKCGVTNLDNPDLDFRYLPGDVCICETCLKEDPPT